MHYKYSFKLPELFGTVIFYFYQLLFFHTLKRQILKIFKLRKHLWTTSGFFIACGLMMISVPGSTNPAAVDINRQIHSLSPYDYLQTHKDKSVDFLMSMYYPSPNLAQQLLTQNNNFYRIHPFFTALTIKKIGQQVCSSDSFQDLHSVFSDKTALDYIAQQRLIPVITHNELAPPIKLPSLVKNRNEFNWLLKEYSSEEFINRNELIDKITIEGMLHDLELRAQTESVANTVLMQLKNPYYRLPSSTNIVGRFQSAVEKIYSFLKSQDLLMQELADSVNSSADDFEEKKRRRLADLINSGYLYKRIYLFNNCDAESMASSGYDIIRSDEAVASMLEACYMPETTQSENNTSDAKLLNHSTSKGYNSSKLVPMVVSALCFSSLFNGAIAGDLQPPFVAYPKNNGKSVATLFNTQPTASCSQGSILIIQNQNNNHASFSSVANNTKNNACCMVHHTNVKFDDPPAVVNGTGKNCNMYASDITVNVQAKEGTLRITDPTDNSKNREVVSNGGRLERMHNGEWSARQHISNAELNSFCRDLGYEGAVSDGKNQAIKDGLSSWENLDNTHQDVETLVVCNYPDLEDPTIRLGNISSYNISEIYSTNVNTKPVYGIPEKKINNEWHPFCSIILTRSPTVRIMQDQSPHYNLLGNQIVFDNIAKVICKELGYNDYSSVPVAHHKAKRNDYYCPENLDCNGTERKIDDCLVPHNVKLGYQVYPWYPVVGCGKKSCQPGDIRLIPRVMSQISDEDITNTGNGILARCGDDHTFHPAFLFKPYQHNHENTKSFVQAACKEMGFSGGKISVLEAENKLIEQVESYFYLSGYTREFWFLLKKNPNLFRKIIDAPNWMYKQSPDLESESPLIVQCNHKNTLVASRKLCAKSSLPFKILLSGKFIDNGICPKCPAQMVDADGVDNGGNKLPCNSTQLFYTTHDKDWLTVWEAWCSESCNLPNEQFHTIVSYAGEKHIISRQRYPYNADADAKGLIRVTHQNSTDSPQLFSAANEEIAVDAFPISEKIINGYLVVLYYSDSEKTAQLVWFSMSSQEQLNNKYYATTLLGKPIALTKDKVLLYNNDQNSIDQYVLSAHNDSSEAMTFSISSKSKFVSMSDLITDKIDFTKDNFIASTIQDKWLYVTTNSNNTETTPYQVNFTRFDLSNPVNHEQWTKNTSHHISNHENHRLFIDNNQLLLVKYYKEKFNADAQFSFADVVETLDLPNDVLGLNDVSDFPSEAVIAGSVVAVVAVIAGSIIYIFKRKACCNSNNTKENVTPAVENPTYELNTNMEMISININDLHRYYEDSSHIYSEILDEQIDSSDVDSGKLKYVNINDVNEEGVSLMQSNSQK